MNARNINGGVSIALSGPVNERDMRIELINDRSRRIAQRTAPPTCSTHSGGGTKHGTQAITEQMETASPRPPVRCFRSWRMHAPLGASQKTRSQINPGIWRG